MNYLNDMNSRSLVVINLEELDKYGKDWVQVYRILLPGGPAAKLVQDEEGDLLFATIATEPMLVAVSPRKQKVVGQIEVIYACLLLSILF